MDNATHEEIIFSFLSNSWCSLNVSCFIGYDDAVYQASMLEIQTHLQKRLIMLVLPTPPFPSTSTLISFWSTNKLSLESCQTQLNGIPSVIQCHRPIGIVIELQPRIFRNVILKIVTVCSAFWVIWHSVHLSGFLENHHSASPLISVH